MVVGKARRLVIVIRTKNALQRVDVKRRGERAVLQRLRYDVPRRAVPLQLDDDHVALAIHAKQVDGPAKVGSNLTSDDQNPLVFENPLRVGLQPLLEDGFLMLDLEWQLLVLLEPAVGLNAKDSHV